MQKTTYATPYTVRGGSRDTWVLFNSTSELAAADIERSHERRDHWRGGSGTEAREYARTGNVEDVPASDAIMSKLEQQAEHIVTRSSLIISDVCGATPNVPAYLAGQPLAMRRRKREHTERAPVCVIYDTTVSAGVSHADMRARGAAVLAFVRLLSARRAVELWAGTGLGTDERPAGAVYCFTRIDTAPLDLARASYMLAHPLATRTLGYGVCTYHGANGHWPYNRDGLNSESFAAVARQAFPHLQEFVAIPGMHMNDKLVHAPVAWILERLAEFGEQGEE